MGRVIAKLEYKDLTIRSWGTVKKLHTMMGA